MRIAVIGSISDKSGHGAVASVLREVCPRLARRGHGIDIFSQGLGALLPAEDNLRAIDVPSWGSFAAGIILRGASPLGRWSDYDVVHVCAEGGGIARLLPRLGISRSVVSLHETPVPANRHPFTARFIQRRAEAAAARCAGRLTVASRKLGRHLHQAYGRSSVFIPNGVTLSERQPDLAPVSTLGLMPGDYVLFGGQLRPEGGAHDLVRAFDGLDTRFKVVIAGAPGGDQAYQTHLAEIADPTKVIVLNEVGSELRAALFAHAFLVVQPTLADQPVTPLLDAVAHRRAVVVSDIPENLELVGADGFSFTMGDVGDLRRVLTWLLADPETVRCMEHRLAKTGIDRLGWDAVADRYERVYASLL